MPMIWQQHANSTSPNEQGLKGEKIMETNNPILQD
jgi:hypothetical protein